MAPRHGLRPPAGIGADLAAHHHPQPRHRRRPPAPGPTRRPRQHRAPRRGGRGSGLVADHGGGSPRRGGQAAQCHRHAARRPAPGVGARRHRRPHGQGDQRVGRHPAGHGQDPHPRRNDEAAHQPGRRQRDGSGMSGAGDTTGITCAEVEVLGPELAIGTLSGGERATALVHLEGCPRCRQLIDELAGVADDLLLLAPETEPPIGFESRTAARIAAAAAPPATPAVTPLPRRERTPVRRRVIAVAAAAFVAGALGASAVAWWTGGPDNKPATSPVVRTAVVRTGTGDTRYSCHAMVVGTNPAWLYVSVTQPGQHDGQYRVEAVGPSTTIPLGTVDVRSGKGAIGVVLKDVAPTDLSELRVFDAGGVLRYQAKFTTTAAPAAPTTIA